jgi:two-component system sensor histidine kinase BaeS
MRAAADGAGVTLATHMPPGPVHVRGDAFALGRVWRNLLQNALDATPAGGSITVAVVVRDQRAEVQVADTGAGIEADRLANLFDEFVTTKRRGLGLGLAICRRIVEQLEGTVGVESEPGRGTTFTVRLPLDEGTGPMGGSTTQAGDRA